MFGDNSLEIKLGAHDAFLRISFTRYVQSHFFKSLWERKKKQNKTKQNRKKNKNKNKNKTNKTQHNKENKNEKQQNISNSAECKYSEYDNQKMAIGRLCLNETLGSGQDVTLCD